MKLKPKDAIPLLAKAAADQAARDLAEDALRDRRKIARNDLRRWYLITIEGRRENTVRGHLIGRGVKVFVPEIRAFRRGARQPMFPGYGFAYLDYEVEWSIVVSRPGVIGVHRGAEGWPVIVPYEIIEKVRREESIELGGLKDAPKPGLAPGDPVRVAEGPFYGFRGKFHEFDGQDRIRVLLDVLGRWTVIGLDLREVVAI